MAHGLETVLAAAEELRDEPRFHFVLVGEGAEKASLRRRAAALRLTNVEFVDQQPRSRVPEWYAACDVGLVMLRDRALFRAVLPSKIFEILACARPVLVGVGGEARGVVEASGAGFYVPPEDPAALAAAARRLASGELDLGAMGRAGRAYVLAHYDRRRQARRYLELLRGVVGSRGGPRPVDPRESADG